MDYYERIQNSVEFIESNLCNELKISDIAAKACFSVFYFQRLFQAISGFSVQEYIRKRRLSEAATLLTTTETAIIDIAITYQYSSQEAFTRAFESYFGVTPAKYRRNANDIVPQVRTDFINYKNIKGPITVNLPNIIVLNTRKVVGYEYRTTLQNYRYYEEIPGFYSDFGKTNIMPRSPIGRLRRSPMGFRATSATMGSFRSSSVKK